MMVGAAPIPTGYATDPALPSSSSRPADQATGNIPGPCVTCHMWDPVTSPMTDTLAYKVGGHSFNTVSP